MASPVAKNQPANAGDGLLIPGLGRSSRGGIGKSVLYAYMENSMDRGAWWVTVHRVAELDTS